MAQIFVGFGVAFAHFAALPLGMAFDELGKLAVGNGGFVEQKGFDRNQRRVFFQIQRPVAVAGDFGHIGGIGGAGCGGHGQRGNKRDKGRVFHGFSFQAA